MSETNARRSYRGGWLLGLLMLPSVVAALVNHAEAVMAVVGGLTRETTSKCGDTYRGVVVMKNDGEEPQEAKIYQTDYSFSCEGTTLYGEPGKSERSNADWVTFSPSRLTIPPKGSAAVDYRVEVPGDKTMRGTYWSMLMVELIGKDSPEATQGLGEGDVAVGIRKVTRLGIQIVTHIEDTGKPRPYFLRTKLVTREGGMRVLQVDMENRGERWMTPVVWAEPYDEEGRGLGRFDGGRKRIFPATSVRYEVDLSDLPEGNYKVLVVADAGNDQVFGANYTLRLQKPRSGE